MNLIKKQILYNGNKKASLTNDDGQTGCDDLENLKLIHIYHLIPALQSSSLSPIPFAYSRMLPGEPHSLGHQITTVLGTCHPTKAKLGIPLLHMC